VDGSFAFYQADGTMIAAYLTPFFLSDAFDLSNWGTHEQPLGLLGVTPDTNPLMLLFWGENNYSNANYMEAMWANDTTGSGIGKLSYEKIEGVEAFSDRSIATIEKAPEFALERWEVDTGAPNYTGKSIAGQGDADNLFYNPKDVTIDTDDWVYVLDILSNGQPRIKVFDDDLIPVKGFGDSTSIPGTPIAIDWDDANDALHVLTSSGVVVFDK
jgi:hypothetical protein